MKNKENENNEYKSKVTPGRVIGKIFSILLNCILTILLIGVITATICGVAFVIYVNNYIDSDMSQFDLMTVDQSMTTKIYYMNFTDRTARIGDRVELEDQRLYASENRLWASYSEMPKQLIDAFVSIEDERFFEHKGVDWKRTLGATLNFLGGTDSYGGSTMTQQLIKNVTGDNEVTPQRKIQEILRALELEKMKSKTEILEMYLNTIFLSQHSYGVKTAASTYFNKDLKDLTLVECAALAAIPKFPTKYDPIQNPEENETRRAVVLKKMLDLGKISEAEYNSAINEELVINRFSEEYDSSTTSWYTDAVIEEAISLIMEEKDVTYNVATRMVYNGGFQIETVMDPKIQGKLEQLYLNDATFPVNYYGEAPQSACVVCDPATGDILGLVGGRGEKSQSRLFNMATQAKRQPGSSIKPLAVYGPALEYGEIVYNSVLYDSPVDVINGRYWPVNYPAGYNGPTTVHDAITRSVNTIAVRTLMKLGVDASYDFVHNKLGMDSFIDNYESPQGAILSDKNLSALALGGMNYGVTVREMTAGYTLFANHGVYNGSRTILCIKDYEGNVVIDNDYKNKTQYLMSEANASIMTHMLQDVVRQGTGSSVRLKYYVDCAGKTGTTSNDYDRWFVGYTPYYVCGVWFGYST